MTYRRASTQANGHSLQIRESKPNAAWLRAASSAFSTPSTCRNGNIAAFRLYLVSCLPMPSSRHQSEPLWSRLSLILPHRSVSSLVASECTDIYAPYFSPSNTPWGRELRRVESVRQYCEFTRIYPRSAQSVPKRDRCVGRGTTFAVADRERGRSSPNGYPADAAPAIYLRRQHGWTCGEPIAARCREDCVRSQGRQTASRLSAIASRYQARPVSPISPRRLPPSPSASVNCGGASVPPLLSRAHGVGL